MLSLSRAALLAISANSSRLAGLPSVNCDGNDAAYIVVLAISEEEGSIELISPIPPVPLVLDNEASCLSCSLASKLESAEEYPDKKLASCLRRKISSIEGEKDAAGRLASVL